MYIKYHVLYFKYIVICQLYFNKPGKKSTLYTFNTGLIVVRMENKIKIITQE